MKQRSGSSAAARQVFQTTLSKTGAENIALCAIGVADRSAIARLELDPEQEQFAGSVDAIFDELQSSRHPELEHPFAILARGAPVGFFILREKHAVPAWATPDVITLHSFRICRALQGQGYGRAGTALAIAWVRKNRPSVKQLMLAVNARNLRAKRLYLDCGFVDSGTIYPGPIGKQHILSRDISSNGG
jgi:GNAT superfamily N-acetyltransferase